MNKWLVRFLLTSLLAGLTFQARASVVEFSSEGDFVAQTGGALQTLPGRDSAYVVTIPGQLRISAAVASGANGIISGPDLYPAIFNLAPNYVAKSGNEDWDIAALAPIYSFGFSLYEPTSSATLNGCNTTCVESTFVINVYSGVSLVNSLTVEPTDNVFNFYGFHSSSLITSITIRETVGTADNEYFGRFFTGSIPLISSVPEPGTLALFGVGVAIARLASNRKTQGSSGKR